MKKGQKSAKTAPKSTLHVVKTPKKDEYFVFWWILGFLGWPILVLIWIFKVLWKIFVAIPQQQTWGTRILGFLRIAVILYVCITIHGDNEDHVRQFVSNFIGSESWGNGIVTVVLGLFALNIILQLLIAFGFAYDNRLYEGGQSTSQHTSGYQGIDETKEMLDVQLKMRSTMGKLRYMSDLFGGKL